jgi:hypothetical protein
LQVTDITSLDDHRKRRAELERKARVQEGREVISTTVRADGDQISIAFSQPIHGLSLEKREAEQLALMVLAAIEGIEQEGIEK